MGTFYILNDDNSVSSTDSVFEWGKSFENDRRRIARDEIGKSVVSTVFLGLDHNFDEGPPLIFETMIFGGKHNDYQERYSTYEEAQEGHKKAVKLVEE